ncbi:hypothetical protein evm_010487 [Chilo suppressalis]|nr:hypothetical protein evm_010487 [Chilo suppressalis]
MNEIDLIQLQMSAQKQHGMSKLLRRFDFVASIKIETGRLTLIRLNQAQLRSKSIYMMQATPKEMQLMVFD